MTLVLFVREQLRLGDPMRGVATRPAVPAAALLRNLRRPTGLSGAFAIVAQSRRRYWRTARVAVKADAAHASRSLTLSGAGE